MHLAGFAVLVNAKVIGFVSVSGVRVDTFIGNTVRLLLLLFGRAGALAILKLSADPRLAQEPFIVLGGPLPRRLPRFFVPEELAPILVVAAVPLTWWREGRIETKK